MELTTVGGVFSILWPSELDGTLEGSITNAVITRIQRQGKEQHYTSEKTIKTLALGRRELYWLHQEAKVGTKKSKGFDSLSQFSYQYIEKENVVTT